MCFFISEKDDSEESEVWAQQRKLDKVRKLKTLGGKKTVSEGWEYIYVYVCISVCMCACVHEWVRDIEIERENFYFFYFEYDCLEDVKLRN